MGQDCYDREASKSARGWLIERSWYFRHGPVRYITNRNGETVNLVGEDQIRSLAALLARKYSQPGHPAVGYWSICSKRELTLAECAKIFEIVGFTYEEKRISE